MKKITLMVVFSVCLLNAMAQNPTAKYKHQITTSLFSVEKHLIDNNFQLSQKYSPSTLEQLIYNIIPANITYINNFNHIFAIYLSTDIKQLYSVYDAERIVILRPVYKRRYMTAGWGISASKKIFKKTDVYAKINAGGCFRTGYEVEYLGNYQPNFCGIDEVRYYRDFGFSFAPQLSYYPLPHWGVHLQSKYTQFLSKNSPEQFLTTLSVGYRFGGAAAKKVTDSDNQEIFNTSKFIKQ